MKKSLLHLHHESQRFSIRKYAIGVACVLVGCFLLLEGQQISADETATTAIESSETAVELTQTGQTNKVEENTQITIPVIETPKGPDEIKESGTENLETATSATTEDSNPVLLNDNQDSPISSQTQEPVAETVKASAKDINIFVERDGHWYYLGEDGQPLTGLQTIDGKTYAFAWDGRQYKGEWASFDGGKTYYFDENDGQLVTNRFVRRFSNWQYLNEQGIPVTGQQTINGQNLYFDKYGNQAKGRLISIDGKIYYTDPHKGDVTDLSQYAGQFLTSEDNRYYVQADGTLITGLQVIDGKTLGFENDGRQIIGRWGVINNQKYYFQEKTGEMLKKQFIKYSKGVWRYLDANGLAVTGLQTIDGQKLYFYSNGNQAKGNFVSINGKAYFTDYDTGVLSDASQYVGQYRQGQPGEWYYINQDGSLAYGLQTIDGQKVYFNDKGIQSKGVINYINGKYYYFDPDTGAMWTNRFHTHYHQNIGNYANPYTKQYYYLGEDGAAYVGGPYKINGKDYMFNDKGIQVIGLYQNADGSQSYYLEEGGRAKNQFSTKIVIQYKAPTAYYHYFSDENEKVATGFFQVGDKIYYSDEKDHEISFTYSLERLITVDNKLYMRNDEGIILTNQTVIYQGKTYNADDKGILTEITS